MIQEAEEVRAIERDEKDAHREHQTEPPEESGQLLVGRADLVAA